LYKRTIAVNVLISTSYKISPQDTNLRKPLTMSSVLTLIQYIKYFQMTG